MESASATDLGLLHFQERSDRFQLAWPLSILDQEAGPQSGQVINISTTGLLITLSAAVAVGSVLQVTLHPAPGVYIKAAIEVVRQQDSTEHPFCYGAGF